MAGELLPVPVKHTSSSIEPISIETIKKKSKFSAMKYVLVLVSLLLAVGILYKIVEKSGGFELIVLDSKNEGGDDDAHLSYFNRGLAGREVIITGNNKSKRDILSISF